MGICFIIPDIAITIRRINSAWSACDAVRNGIFARITFCRAAVKSAYLGIREG